MDELIARLEAASEGSRELDGLIWSAAFPDVVKERFWFRGKRYAGHIHTPAEKLEHVRRSAEYHASRYTTSIDAALTLVPEGERVVMERQYHPEGNCYACVWGPNGNRSNRARTLPLALCIAALRALSHTAPQEK